MGGPIVEEQAGLWKKASGWEMVGIGVREERAGLCNSWRAAGDFMSAAMADDVVVRVWTEGEVGVEVLFWGITLRVIF